MYADPACQLTSQHIAIPTPEQITSLTHLLGLGDKEDMSTLDHSKRYALARLFNTTTYQQTEQQQLPLLTVSTSRRHALAAIVGTAAAAMGLSQEIGFPQLHPQETLLLCASNIPLCWSLYFEGGLTETKQHITPYLSQLADLVSRSSTYQKEAATLASQAYQLAALTEILLHNMGIALEHAKRSINFAAFTGDHNLLTAAHIRLAVVYSNLDRPHHRLTAYEEAAKYCKNTSPLLQARVYAGLTETYSALGDEKAAFKYLELTHRNTPTNYDADPNFSYAHFDPWSIHMYEKDMWVNLGKLEEAWKTLEKSHQLVEPGLTVNRVDLTIKQTEISLMLGNLEASHSYLTQAAKGAASLGSQLLMEEVHGLYYGMKRKWPNEPGILQIEEQLRTA
jgi:hypothetical protein